MKSLARGAIAATMLGSSPLAAPAEDQPKPAISQPIPKRQWRGIVVHHSDSPEWTTVKDIDRWHRERTPPFDEIGYHYVITTDGKAHVGRSLNKHGAHAKGPRNETHIGICLIGKKTFTPQQKQTLGRLINSLMRQYPIEIVERHHEECPGAGIDVEQLDQTVKQYNEKRL